MTLTLIIGDYAYSSWSLRGWLAAKHSSLSVEIRAVDFHKAGVAEQMPDAAPARTVPTLLLDDDTPVWDSLALAEELASRAPHAGLWPADPTARAVARSLAAEMHSGFSALRSACPMNLRVAYRDVPVSPEVRADLDRIETIWAYARARFGRAGAPWLCGDYSLADMFFAPVAARIAGYGLAVGPEAQEYVAAHLADPAFRRWRAMGQVRGETLARYVREFAVVPWPGPDVAQARAVAGGPSRNKTCPYSGKPVAHYLSFRGQTWGFCNAFCRDKTVADPDAWPDFMEMVTRG